MKTQTFGIEIEMNHITRQRAAQVVAETLGEGATFRHAGGAYDAWEVTAPDGRRWKLVSDASIAGPRDQGTEFVSPICRWEDIETVQACVRALRAAGAHADPSCGIHVHVGLGEHTPKTLRNLVNLVNAKEDLLTQALQISPERRSRWCQPVDPPLVPARRPGLPRDPEPPPPDHLRGVRPDLVRRPRLGLPRTPALRPLPVPPAEPAQRFPEGHHRVPGLQQHTSRRRGQGLHPALPHGGFREPGPPGHRQPGVHLPVLAPPAGHERRGVQDRPHTPPEAHARQRGLEERCRDHPPGLLNPAAHTREDTALKPTRLMMARRHRAETGHRNRPVAGSRTASKSSRAHSPRRYTP